MGDMADLYNGDLPDDYYRRITCKFCGKRDLEWDETPQGWRLFTQKGNLHQCKTLKSAQQEPKP
jgi:hypothetical protein